MEVLSSSVAAASRQTDANGGFPNPAAGQAVRLVRARHEACGETTLIRVPRALPSCAVRLATCGHCGERFECEAVDELGVLSAAPQNAGGTARPTLPTWWRAPVALAAVVGGLLLIQGPGGDDGALISEPPRASVAEPKATPQSPATAPATPATGAAAAGGQAAVSNDAQLIRGTKYAIALPQGWKETTPSGGATFSAAAADGSADATLWVRNDPELDFPTFEASSLAQLRSLAGSAHVASRVSAPTPEGTVVRLAADAPEGQPAYAVTLRVSGPYKYYLSTTLQPDASPEATKGVELLSNSLTPVSK